ncbi:MAG: thiopurine S-methyltransferase [Gammaproteobacteria bacterium]|nr:thiopurine S-methyltransferase [Gammaproteobacteria bacterium]
MHPDFWHERWQANQIGFHQDEINPYLVRYWPGLATDTSGRVLVPLCGKSRDMIWLLDQGYSVLGVEISPIAVEAFFAEYNMTPTVRREAHCSRWAFDGLELLCGDFFALDRRDIGEVAAVYDRAALIALPPDMRPRYADQLASLLGKTTTGLLITLEYKQDEMNGPPFSVSDAEVEQLYGDRYTIERLCSSDVLEANQRFREQGVTRLTEQAFRLGDRKTAKPE